MSAEAEAGRIERASKGEPTVREVMEELTIYMHQHPQLRIGQALDKLGIGYYTTDAELLARLADKENPA